MSAYALHSILVKQFEGEIIVKLAKSTGYLEKLTPNFKKIQSSQQREREREHLCSQNHHLTSTILKMR